MNNKNKILVGCLALLLVLSVGYALFSETITINGTATAKGDFDITTTCSAGFMDDLVSVGAYTSTDQDQNGFSNDSCSVSGNEVTFNTTLAYPGATRYFTVKLTNTGSIPATLDIDKLTDDYLLSNLTKKVCALQEDGSVSTNCTQNIEYKDILGFDSSASPVSSNKFGIIKAGEYCDFFDDCIYDFSSLSLNTGDSMYYSFPLRWPENYASGYEYGFQATVSAQIPLIQYTAQ